MALEAVPEILAILLALYTFACFLDGISSGRITRMIVGGLTFVVLQLGNLALQFFPATFFTKETFILSQLVCFAIAVVGGLLLGRKSLGQHAIYLAGGFLVLGIALLFFEASPIASLLVVLGSAFLLALLKNERVAVFCAGVGCASLFAAEAFSRIAKMLSLSTSPFAAWFYFAVVIALGVFALLKIRPSFESETSSIT